MPISDRDYIRGEHPPSCTCKECTERKLGKLSGHSSSKGRKETLRRTKPTSLHSTIPPVFQTIVRKPFHRIWINIPLSVHKLFLSLLVIAGLVDIIQRGYTLFTHQTDPVKNTIIFLVEVGLWFWIVAILRSRRYKYRKPKFKLVFVVVIAITLVGTFAGIEPLSSYKDNLTSKWASYQAEHKAKEAKRVAEAIAMTPALIKEAPTRTEIESSPTTTQTLKVEEAEREAFELINKVRQEAGAPPTKWNDELYKLSKAHTQDMANKGELFHTPIGATHGENAWGGRGYYHYKYEELARVIVSGWMSSPLHKAWLLHAPIQESVVSIVITPDGQYASWSFWTINLGRGPELVEKIAREWRNSGSNLPWIEWLYIKGYLEK